MGVTKLAKDWLTEIFGRQTRKILAKHDPIIVAVAGSVGKTSTKLAIATVLKQGFRVRYQKGNYNTPISVPFIFTGRDMPSLYNPLSWASAYMRGRRVLKGKFPYDVVVVELGTDAPGDIAHFKKLLHPKITVVTAVAEEHMQFFKTIEAVAKEELGVSQYSDKLVINIDDVDQQYISKYIDADKPTLTYGFGAADYQITAKPDAKGYLVTIELEDGSTIATKTSSIAEQNLKSVAAAVAVADILGMSEQNIKKGVSNITAIPGRMQALRGINNSIIIDDSYNSSPLAAEAALKTIYGLHVNQRVAVLGSMNELGEYSREGHERVGKYCDSKKLDLIITIGNEANKYLAPAAEASGCKVIKTSSPYQAAQIVKENLQPRSLILVKGSQNGVFSEEAVKMLLANRKDSKKLVRQNSFWIKKKHQQFSDFS